MARQLFQNGIFSVLSAANAFGVGWQLAFYQADTTTPIDTYNAPVGGSANANPVPADAEGRFPQIWIDDGQSIKWSLLDEDGAVKVTVDDYAIPAQPPSFSTDLDDFLSDPSNDPLPIAFGGTGSTSAINALGALGAFPAAGGTVNGPIIRQGAGLYHYWHSAAMVNGNWYLTSDAEPDPTSAPGQVWAKHAP